VNDRSLRRICQCALAILVLASVVVFAGRPTAEAEPVAPADGYGFSVGAPQIWMSQEDADRELDAAAKTDARWMRVHIDWQAIEKVRGQFDWGYVDHWVDGARQRGMKVLGLIVNTPEWAKAPGTALYGPPINAADYATFAATVVTRYRDRVSDWEIWNEPNLPRFLGFAERQAAVYTGLLKAAYPAIKSVQPGATVIAAGLSPAVGIDAPPNFLNDMYVNGAKGYFDAIGMHPYVFPGGVAADPGNGWSDLARAHDVMTLNGDGDKKVWLTEFGAPTSAPSADGVSQEEQAKQITDLLAGAAGTGWSGPAFIYSIRDIDSANRDDREDNFGALLTTDWQPKYAASVLVR
jgi:polysaccharide biosynthesis protein PslG